MFLILTFSSFFAVACGENEIESIGGTERTNSVLADRSVKPSKPGIGELECIEELENILVTSFIKLPTGWMGGLIGIGFALNVNSVPSGSTILNADMFRLDGCNTLLSSGRLAFARVAYSGKVALLQAVVNNPANYTPQVVQAAENWLDYYKAPASFQVKFPNNTVGYYRIGANRTLTHEIVCDA